MATPLPSGVSEHTVDTDRVRMRYTQSGDAGGTPVVLVHGNLSTCRFFDELMAACPSGYTFIAPDMRGFGGSEPVAIDATRGLRDWSDDILALLDALDIDGSFHSLGWSTGGGALMQLLIDHPDRLSSLSLVGSVSPYGFGGTNRDGSPCTPDHAGTGGGAAAPDFMAQLRARNLGLDSPFAIRNVMRTSYWSPVFSMDEDREVMLAEEVLDSLLGDDGYPGDSTTSDNWPGFAPGGSGILNALSPKYLDTSAIVDVQPKPPIMWHRGSADVVVADGSAWDPAALGQAGMIPGWPGPDEYPVQEMVSQLRDVLDDYADTGGSYEEVVYDGAGHGPFIDHAEDFIPRLLTFIQDNG